MENSSNKNSSSQLRGPGGPGTPENTNAAGRTDTHSSSNASYATPLPFNNSQFNFPNSRYTSSAPATSEYNSFAYTNDHYDQSYSTPRPGQYVMPHPPADLRGSTPGTPATQLNPRTNFTHPPTDRHTPSQPVPNRRRPPPNFTFPPTFGSMPQNDHFHYIPPPSPRPVDSDSDNLPDPGTMHASAKARGKRPAETPDSADEKAQSGMKKKRTLEDAPKSSRKKPSVSRAAQAKAATAKVKVKTEPKPGPRATKGRQSGSRNFSNEENLHLLDCVNRRLPIGGAGWQAVASEYNPWARKHGYAERDHKSIKGKFDTLVRTAKEKPTGVANRDPKTNPLAIALAIDGAIEEKSGTLTLNDPEFAEADNDGEAASEEEVIEITDDDDMDAVKKPKLGGTTKDTVMTKAYRVAEPLAITQQRRPQNSAATEALSSLTNLFNPSVLRERDETRMAQSVHLTQLASVQQEVRELRARNDVLNDRLIHEIRRADRAESEIQLIRTLERSQRRRRRHDSEDDYDDTSPPPRLARRRYPYPVQTTSVPGYQHGPHRREHVSTHRAHLVEQQQRRQIENRGMDRSGHVVETEHSQQEFLDEPQSTITFFGHQPAPSRSRSRNNSPIPGPSGLQGLDSLAAVAASISESPDDPLEEDQDAEPTFSSITLTPRRNRDGKLSFEVQPNH